jgi:hypothetical protein
MTQLDSWAGSLVEHAPQQMVICIWANEDTV